MTKTCQKVCFAIGSRTAHTGLQLAHIRTCLLSLHVNSLYLPAANCSRAAINVSKHQWGSFSFNMQRKQRKAADIGTRMEQVSIPHTAQDQRHFSVTGDQASYHTQGCPARGTAAALAPPCHVPIWAACRSCKEASRVRKRTARAFNLSAAARCVQLLTAHSSRVPFNT